MNFNNEKRPNNERPFVLLYILVKTFSDGSFVEFGKGNFDSWCVFLTIPPNEKHAPRDYRYFKVLQAFGNHYGKDKVYKDFVEIYNLTDSNISVDVLNKITELAKHYAPYSVKFDIVLTVVYLGMIAEENKAGTKLGKRIKRLGLHQVLVENMTPIMAANFSKGHGWRFIDNECKLRGF